MERLRLTGDLIMGPGLGHFSFTTLGWGSPQTLIFPVLKGRAEPGFDFFSSADLGQAWP